MWFGPGWRKVIMRSLFKTIAGTAFALAVASPAAHAQFFFFGSNLRQDRVERSLEAQGYQLVSPLARNGNVYLADVIGPRGPVRLVIDASTGEVLERFRSEHLRPPAEIGGPQLVERPAPVPAPHLLSGDGPFLHWPFGGGDQVARGEPDTDVDPAVSPNRGAEPAAKAKPRIVKHHKNDTSAPAEASAPATNAPSAPNVITPSTSPARVATPSGPSIISVPPAHSTVTATPLAPAAVAPAAPAATAAVSPSAPAPLVGAAAPKAPRIVGVHLQPTMEPGETASKTKKPVNDVPVAPLE
jgi:hypothetical protein